MLPAELEKPLALMELQCQAVAAAVTNGQPVELEAASQSLRDTALAFSAFMDSIGGAAQAGPQLRTRLKKLATNLGIQREALLRRSAASTLLCPPRRRPPMRPRGVPVCTGGLRPEARIFDWKRGCRGQPFYLALVAR